MTTDDQIRYDLTELIAAELPATVTLAPGRPPTVTIDAQQLADAIIAAGWRPPAAIHEQIQDLLTSRERDTKEGGK